MMQQIQARKTLTQGRTSKEKHGNFTERVAKASGLSKERVGGGGSREKETKPLQKSGEKANAPKGAKNKKRHARRNAKGARFRGSAERVSSRGRDDDDESPAPEERKCSLEQVSDGDDNAGGGQLAKKAALSDLTSRTKKKKPDSLGTHDDGTDREKEREKEEEKERCHLAAREARCEMIMKWCLGVMTSTPAQLSKEYKAVGSTISENECVHFHKNPDSNRYNNIPCLDRTRVTIPDDDNFYIHANKVKVLARADRFVCTQGPLDNTMNDFWRMAVALESHTIIMLCGFFEDGMEKCSKYFSEIPGLHVDFDHVKVATDALAEIDFPGGCKDKVIHRLLRVTVNTTGRVHRLHHYQWTTWPDHGMPESCEPTLRLLSMVRKSRKPIIVHCSAGVGRTGTLVLVESLISALRFPKRQNVKDTFALLRKDRAKSVQTPQQYIYALRCAIEYFHLKGYKQPDHEWDRFKEMCVRLNRRPKVVKPKDKNKKKTSLSAELLSDTELPPVPAVVPVQAVTTPVAPVTPPVTPGVATPAIKTTPTPPTPPTIEAPAPTPSNSPGSPAPTKSADSSPSPPVSTPPIVQTVEAVDPALANTADVPKPPSPNAVNNNNNQIVEKL